MTETSSLFSALSVQDNAIDIHLKMIEEQTTVNLYRLELHDLHDIISPDICNQLINNAHKKSQIINSKLDLLQAFFTTEHNANTACVSYFHDKRNVPVLHVHTSKQITYIEERENSVKLRIKIVFGLSIPRENCLAITGD